MYRRMTVPQLTAYHISRIIMDRLEGVGDDNFNDVWQDLSDMDQRAIIVCCRVIMQTEGDVPFDLLVSLSHDIGAEPMAVLAALGQIPPESDHVGRLVEHINGEAVPQ